MGDGIQGDLIHTSEGYKTCDLYLAAFFATAGCPIKKTPLESRKVYFLFEDNSLLTKLRSNYYLRQASVDALTYSDQIKSLKSLCASLLSNVVKRMR